MNNLKSIKTLRLYLISEKFEEKCETKKIEMKRKSKLKK